MHLKFPIECNTRIHHNALYSANIIRLQESTFFFSDPFLISRAFPTFLGFTKPIQVTIDFQYWCYKFWEICKTNSKTVIFFCLFMFQTFITNSTHLVGNLYVLKYQSLHFKLRIMKIKFFCTHGPNNIKTLQYWKVQYLCYFCISFLAMFLFSSDKTQLSLKRKNKQCL